MELSNDHRDVYRWRDLPNCIRRDRVEGGQVADDAAQHVSDGLRCRTAHADLSLRDGILQLSLLRATVLPERFGQISLDHCMFTAAVGRCAGGNFDRRRILSVQIQQIC